MNQVVFTLFVGIVIRANNCSVFDCHVGAERKVQGGQAGLKHDGSLRFVSHSPDGRYVASASGGKVYVWDCKTASLSASFQQRNYSGNPFTARPVFLKDSSTVAWGNSDGVWLWNWSANAPPKKIVSTRSFLDPRTSVFFSFEIIRLEPSCKSNEWLAYADEGGQVMLYAIGSNKSLEIRKPARQGIEIPQRQTVAALSWSPNSNVLAIADDDASTLELIDIDEMRQVRRRTKTPAPIRSLGFSKDGTTLVGFACEKFTYVWDIDLKLKKTLETQHGKYSSLKSQPGTDLIAVGDGETGLVHVWSIDDARVLTKLQGQRSGIIDMSFSGNQLITAGEDETVRIFSMKKTGD